jgi:dihydrofolate reductase
MSAPRLVGWIAASLHGANADAEGGVGWLDPFAAHDHGYDTFYAGIDALVMGRTTYESVRGFGPWPYPAKPALVLTGRPLPDAPPGVTAAPPDFAALPGRLAALGARQTWVVGGGRTLAGALAAQVLDRLTVFAMPVVLGRGPLLLPDAPMLPARAAGCRLWPSGAVETVWTFSERAEP